MGLRGGEDAISWPQVWWYLLLLTASACALFGLGSVTAPCLAHTQIYLFMVLELGVGRLSSKANWMVAFWDLLV